MVFIRGLINKSCYLFVEYPSTCNVTRLLFSLDRTFFVEALKLSKLVSYNQRGDMELTSVIQLLKAPTSVQHEMYCYVHSNYVNLMERSWCKNKLLHD